METGIAPLLAQAQCLKCCSAFISHDAANAGASRHLTNNIFRDCANPFA